MKKALSCLTLLFVSSLSAALTPGKMGAEFAYGGSVGTLATSDLGQQYVNMPGVGFWYHFSQKVAISAKVAGFFTDLDSLYSTTSSGTNRRNSKTLGGGLSLEVPFYIADFDPVLLFLGPGAGFNYAHTTDTITGPNQFTIEKYSYFISAFAVIGLQFPLHEKLHIFGRTTLGYTGGILKQGSYYDDYQHTKNAFIGLQSWGLGIVFYLN